MPLPALVLVHGGVHAADCWDLTIAELRRQEPQLKTFAVDLPGRRGKPGPGEAISQISPNTRKAPILTRPSGAGIAPS